MIALLAAGCAAGTSVPLAAGTASPSGEASAPSSGEAIASPSTSGLAAASGWTWGELPPVAEDPSINGNPNGDAMGDGSRAGEQLGDGATDLDLTVGDAPPPTSPEPVPEFDPCTLTQPAEWSAFAPNAISTPVQLEYGDACGWMNDGDTVRLAIALLPRGPDGGFLSDDDARAAGGLAIDGLGDSAWWVAGWPVPQSSTLVVVSGDNDLVVEMSWRNGSNADQMLAGAKHFAELALVRVP
jgi:hypothetical protein